MEEISIKDIELLLDNKGLFEEAPFEERYKVAVYDQEIINVLALELPPIHDISDKLPLTNGKVYAIRMDLNEGVDNHKKHPVAGLILRNILAGFITSKKEKTIIDGGNFNSAKALRYYTEKFHIPGIYIVSRLFPKEIIAALEGNRFKIEKALENPGMGREREFYDYLYNKFKTNSAFRSSHVPLRHARWGGTAMRPFGQKIAEVLDFEPEYIVSGLGAGTTLEGIQIPVKEKYLNTKIVVAENEESPLFVKKAYPTAHAKITNDIKKQYSHPEKYTNIEGVPHSVIGPHYDEINPLLSKQSQGEIDLIMQYGEQDRQSLSQFTAEKSMPVGNSTAANLACAVTLANRGCTVLTIVYEPRRFFYEKKGISDSQ